MTPWSASDLGRRAELRPLTPTHYDFLYEVICDPQVAWRWRYRGAIPSKEQFQSQLWDSVLAQKLVVDRRRQAMAGAVSVYNYNPRGKNCYAAAVAHPAFDRTGVVLEGLLLLIDYTFATWDMRKIFFEVLSFNEPQFAGIAEACECEGRLTDYEFASGRYWDLMVYSLTRETWMTYREQLRLDRPTVSVESGLP